MIIRILLLITMTFCVCGKPYKLAPNYQAKENNNVTVEWKFNNTDVSDNFVKIHCVLFFSKQQKVFFNLDKSRAPCAEDNQHEQFFGRVQYDKDALRAGLVRLHLSRVRAEDSGPYLCRMATKFQRMVKQFSLNVTPATDEPKPEKQKPQPVSRDRVCLYVGVGLVAAAAAVVLFTYRCTTYSSA